MHPRLILAIARKDALDILMNKSTMSILLSPIFLAVLFLGVGTLLGNKTTDILLYNPSKSNVELVVKGAYQDSRVVYANSPEDVFNTFGTNGTHKKSSYAIGLIVPANFDSSLRSGEHPSLQLFVNGDQLSQQQATLLLSAVTNYARNAANPQPPANISFATINPAKVVNTATFDVNVMYAATVLLTSFLVGTSLVPGILAEEKEKKTLRMLMVTPASFTDVVMGKLLVGFSYQLVLTLAVLGIEGGYRGEVPALVGYALLGSCFSVSLGLFAGSLFQTTSTAGMFSGIVSIIYIAPIFFVGLFAQILGNNPFLPVAKILPTYYIADGATNALLGVTTLSGTLLDVGFVLGSIVVLLVIATWFLRRQAAVAAAI